MNIFEIIILSISLCADSFASSISKGICFKRVTLKHILTVAISFAIFQTLMPYLGYILGNTFSNYVIKIGNVISFIILTLIGISMIKEKEEELDDSINIKDIILLSISVSLDALAIGVSFSCLNLEITVPLISIFITTFITSFLGVILGSIVGNKYNQKALLYGGLVLISIGIKILLF